MHLDCLLIQFFYRNHKKITILVIKILTIIIIIIITTIIYTVMSYDSQPHINIIMLCDCWFCCLLRYVKLSDAGLLHKSPKNELKNKEIKRKIEKEETADSSERDQKMLKCVFRHKDNPQGKCIGTLYIIKI